MANLADFVNAIKSALVGAGYAPTDANVQKAIDLWNAVGGANMSTAEFIDAIRYSFAAAGQPTSAPAMQPPQPAATQAPQPAQTGLEGYTIPVQPGLQQQNFILEQETYWRIAQLEAQTSQDIANINASTSRYVADLNAQTQQALASGNINAQQAMLAQELAQREAEFARDLTLRQLIADREYEIAQEQLRLNELEIRSQLAANPADWLTYQAFLSGGQLPEVGAGAEAGGPESANVIQQIAESLTQGGGPLYNPELAGAGVAGAHVPGPQEIGRYQLYSMNPTELEMFSGFLKGGIDINGNRVAINPEDWFQQAQRSWVPTVPEQSFIPQYAF